MSEQNGKHQADIIPIVNDLEDRQNYSEQKIDNLCADTRLILNVRLPEIRADIADARYDIKQLGEENRALADETKSGINRLGFAILALGGAILWQILFK